MTASYNSNLPAVNAYEVTVDNTTAQIPTRNIYVGSEGDLKITTLGGDTVTFGNVPAGTTLPVRAEVIFDTGTTASEIVGMY